MAVAEAKKMEKTEDGSGTAPAWLAGGMSWGPRKFGELKSFFAEVRSELKKVTWPSQGEVKNTTVVVILTTVFFGFYLWGLDLVFTELMRRVMGSST
jgi:preprotein translocase subunit SecE